MTLFPKLYAIKYLIAPIVGTVHGWFEHVSSHFKLASRVCHRFIIRGIPSTYYAKNCIWLAGPFFAILMDTFLHIIQCGNWGRRKTSLQKMIYAAPLSKLSLIHI